MLSGTVPTEIGVASALGDVLFASNLFSGALPTELGNLKKPGSLLDLSHNGLSGDIPSQLGQTSPETIKLAFNLLDGKIPTELGMLNNETRYLGLQSNMLTGPIPSQLGLLNSDKWSAIRLNGNLLSGSVPTELGSFKMLNISDNPLLQGRIPNQVCKILNCEDGNEWNTCWLHFDCSENLCGCNNCLCSDEHPANV